MHRPQGEGRSVSSLTRRVSAICRGNGLSPWFLRSLDPKASPELLRRVLQNLLPKGECIRRAAQKPNKPSQKGLRASACATVFSVGLGTLCGSATSKLCDHRKLT